MGCDATGLFVAAKDDGGTPLSRGAIPLVEAWVRATRGATHPEVDAPTRDRIIRKVIPEFARLHGLQVVDVTEATTGETTPDARSS